MASKKFWSDFVSKLTSLVGNDKIMIADSADADIVKYTDFSTLESSIYHNNTDNVQIAANGVTYGHITDISQTIFGAKTFNDVLTVGDLVVNGVQTIINSQTVEVKDNILLINNGEVGAGVTAGTAGIEVDRGALTNYLFIFDETTDAFKIGQIGSLQEVATREDAPVDGSVAIWDDVNKRFKTVASNTLVSGLNADKIDGYDINQDLQTTASPTFPTIKLTNLTDNYLPLHQSDTNGLIDSIISQNVTGIGIGKTASEKLDVNGSILSRYDVNGTAKIKVDNQNTGVNAYSSFEMSAYGNNFFIKNYNDNYPSKANLTEFLSTASMSEFGFIPANTEIMRLTSSGVAIGKTTADEKLDVAGDIKISGNMLRMTGITTTVRDGLTAVAGDIIYNTTINKHQAYDGTTWNNMY